MIFLLQSRRKGMDYMVDHMEGMVDKVCLDNTADRVYYMVVCMEDMVVGNMGYTLDSRIGLKIMLA